MKKILFIDDDLIGLEDVFDFFALAGYDVLIAESVATAIDILKTEGANIQAVVLDIIMPYGDISGFNSNNTAMGMRTGLALLDRIRQLYPLVPILVFTNLRDNEAKEKAIKSGAKIYIEKPASLSELFNKVEEFIANKEKGE